MKPAPKDPFDYKLRSKEEIIEEFKYYEEPFTIQAEYKKYTAGDTRMEDNLDTRDRVAKVTVNLTEMGLAPLQRQRFIFLLGNRFNGSDKVKIVCKQYNTWHENFVRANEILRELYWEAKRAPDTNTTALTNPYRREFFKKKFEGRTREERLATQQELLRMD
jgi:Mitochondrial ribosomal subunit protein